jgi:ATP-binding cassette subfamily C (CFTR/MRP) protein 1
MAYAVQALAAIDVALQVASIIFWAKHPLTNISIPAACLSTVAAFGVLALVTVEHTRIATPSTLGTIYLVCAILSNAVQIRTFRIRLDAPVIFRLLLASTADKILLLGLEQWPKTRILKLAREYSPEERSGIIARALFTWLLPLFQKGYRTIISQGDLFPLDEQIMTEKVQEDMAEYWERCKSQPYPIWLP